MGRYLFKMGANTFGLRRSNTLLNPSSPIFAMHFSSQKPRLVGMLVGNPTAFSRAREWAKLWAAGTAQKPLMVHGPTGVGKTALAHAIAAEFNWDIFEFNASDLRDEESVSSLLANSTQSSSLFGGLRLILVDDVDSLSGRNDRGGMGAISKVLQAARQPVILTATDYWGKSIQPLRAHCEPLELRHVQAGTIANLLKKLAASEKLTLTQEQIEKIASAAGGDVRAALNDLQGGNTAATRDSEKNIFEVVRTIFKSEKYGESRAAAFSSDTERDMLKWWISSNLPLEYDRPFDLAEAYNSLSRADVFDGRISRTQYWGYLRYSTDHLSAGVSTAKTAPYHKYTQLSFPGYIQQMGSSKSGRQGRKAVLKKISVVCHCSLSQAATYLPQIEIVAKKTPTELSQFGFDEDDIEFLASKGKAKKSPARKTAKA